MTRKKVLLLHPQTFHRSIVRIEVLGVPCNMTSKFWRRQTGGRKRLLTDYRREDPSIEVLVAKPTQARNTRRKSAMVIGKHTCRSSYFCDTARHGPHIVTSSTEILMLSRVYGAAADSGVITNVHRDDVERNFFSFCSTQLSRFLI